MGQLNYSFPKKERLSGKKKIEELFKRGSSFYLDAFYVRHYPCTDDLDYHQVLISVSKRNFKRAVDRNLIKRRVREAYRQNKHHISGIIPLYIGFVYLSKKILTFHEIQDQLIKCLKRLEKNNIK